MCLSVPVKLIKVEGNRGVAEFSGTEINISLHLVENVKEGDYVLVHTGMALEVVSEEIAKETLELLMQLSANREGES